MSSLCRYAAVVIRLVLIAALGAPYARAATPVVEPGQARLGVASANFIDELAIWPDGRHLLTHQRSTAANGEDSLRLWELSTGRVVRRFSCPPEVRTQLKGSAQAGRKIIVECDGATQVWDVASGQMETLPANLASARRETYGLSSSAPDAPQFTVDGRGLVSLKDGVATLSDASSGRELRRFEAQAAEVMAVAFSPDGRLVLTGGGARRAALWDLASGREIRRYTGHSMAVAAVAFSPDGKQVLTGSHDQTARLWDTATGRELRRYGPMPSRILSVGFSPDGSQLLTGDMVGSGVWLWDAASGRRLATFSGSHGVFSPDGRRLATADREVRLWDLATGREAVPLGGDSRFSNAGGVHALAFSPDGSRLLAGRTAATVMWDVASGRQLGRYGSAREWVQGVAFSPDGARALSGNWSGQVHLWDLASGRHLRSLQGHDSSITAVAFSPRGELVLSGSNDGSTRLWRSDTGEELAALYSFNDGSSAVIDRQGRFDAPNGGHNAHLYWVVGLETIGLAQLKERYFEPGLLPKVLGLGSTPLREVAALTGVALYPRVEIVQRPTPAQPLLRVRLSNQGGGIGRVVVRVNGRELSEDARPRTAQDDNAKELLLQLDMAAALKGFDPAGANHIEVLAYNAAGYLSSRGQVEAYEAASNAAAAAPPTLWAVVVGTSTYADAKIDLRFPAKDARDMARALELGGRALFGADRVKLKLLSSDGNQAEQPTRANLRAAFEALKQARPGDIVVVYLAGHGVAAKDLYYYPSQEAGSLLVEDPAVWAQRAVSSDELAVWLKDSPALKQVLLLDTCAAGAAARSLLAVRDTPADQIRALDRMKDRAGVYVLMGAAADRVSYESSEYQQGLLTYALLKGMSGERLREGQYVDIAPLLDYVADQVPLLARGIGGIQKPYVASPGSGAVTGKVSASFDIGRLGPDERRQIVLHSPRPLLLTPRLQNTATIEDDLKLGALLRDRLRETSHALARGAAAPIVYVEADEMAGAIQLSGLYTVNTPGLQVQLLLRRGEARASLKLDCRSTALDACASAMEQKIVDAAAQLR
ncbi:MAG: hypothetical protein RIQ60_3775 [Pseudomonadota bacterium]|jgi:WD40 repeat protein